MGRLTIVGALLSLALGSALALPVAAQAATPAHTAVSHTVTPGIAPNGQWEYSGLSYPDTPAGLAACNAEGEYLFSQNPHVDQNWSCKPYPNSYELWIYFVSGG